MMKNISINDSSLPINALQDYFAAQENIYAAYLFGSYSRAQQTENSDVDILVNLKYENNRFDYFAFMDIQADLTEICQKKVDLISEQSLSPFMMPYIQQEKQLIYEREIGG